MGVFDKLINNNKRNVYKSYGHKTAEQMVSLGLVERVLEERRKSVEAEASNLKEKEPKYLQAQLAEYLPDSVPEHLKESIAQFDKYNSATAHLKGRGDEIEEFSIELRKAIEETQ